MASERHNKTRERVLEVNELLFKGQTAAMIRRAAVAVNGTAIHAAVVAWTNPELNDIVISRVEVDTGASGQAKSTGASTLSVGTTAVSATTASQNLIDTLDVGTATGIFDNITDKGAGGKSRQRLAPGAWVTFSQQSGDTTGLIGTAYIYYTLV